MVDVRQYQAKLRVLPPRQNLKPCQLAGMQFNDRLKARNEFVVFDRTSHVGKIYQHPPNLRRNREKLLPTSIQMEQHWAREDSTLGRADRIEMPAQGALAQETTGAISRDVATRLRPSSFALYIALSAANSKLSGILIDPPSRASAVATPTLTVTFPPPSGFSP